MSFGISPFRRLIALKSMGPVAQTPDLFTTISGLDHMQIRNSGGEITAALPSGVLQLNFFSGSFTVSGE